ncbi:thioredoxin family protein [Enterococcus sp. BWR-S5]|uniref:thioredoxin family protein n=1 Tax=Enterococcus sp. BWR-S5 TaxID=2787714 RepID=UPI001924DCD1|nr:thioredoxin family protein [Enterococcus sp. BWR-S5]MBL1226018.1 thioredoxin family protein [Enterococcus sp. BWR-S5]
MVKLHQIEAIGHFIEAHEFAFIYVSQPDCSVCHSVLPKLKELLKSYPDIALGEVDGAEVPQVTAAYQVFSAPTLLLFINGKEYIREGRFVQFQKLTFDLDRLYTFGKENVEG